MCHFEPLLLVRVTIGDARVVCLSGVSCLHDRSHVTLGPARDRRATPGTCLHKGTAIRRDEQDHKALVLWATDRAEHVLRCFEEQDPDDRRPRTAIVAGWAWVYGEMTMSDVRAAAFAAHAAARDTDSAVACAAARAAGHARHAVTYAVTAVKPAAGEAAGSAETTTKECAWQERRLGRPRT